MTPFQPFKLESTQKNTSSVTNSVLSLEKTSPTFHPFEEEWVEPYVSIKRRQQHHRVLNIQKKTRAPLLLCILALAVLLTGCFRAGRLGLLSSRNTNKGRRLAGGRLPGNEGNENEEAKIVEMCLDMEEAAGSSFHPAWASLPQTQEEAIPLLLHFFKEPPPQQVGNSLSPLAPSVPPTLTLPYRQPGPSYVRPEAAGWGSFHFLSHQEAVPMEEAFIPSWQHPQSLSQQQQQHQQEQQEQQEQPGSDSRRRRRESGLDQGESEIISPKKHISGWKGKEQSPSAAESAPFSQQQPQPVEVGGGCFDYDDRLAKAVDAVPEEYSPPSLSSYDSAESSDMQEEETDPLLSSLESVPLEEPHSLWLCLSPTKQPPPAPSQEEGGEGESLLLDSPGPTASQGIRRALPPAPPQEEEDPSPGPSREGYSFTTSPLLSNEETGEAQQQSASPSSAGWPTSPSAPQGQPTSSHLFYRLPLLQPGHLIRRFVPARAFREVNMRSRLQGYLGEMRFFLAQPEITAEDAESLIYYSEIVAGYVLGELQTLDDRGWPSQAVRRLGRIFLALDALIATIAVLGPAMNAHEWWPVIERGIPPRRVYSSERNHHSTRKFAALATELSGALQTLRHCMRLTEKETIELKRRLICSTDTVPEFRESRWDPWREDDAKSGGT